MLNLLRFVKFDYTASRTNTGDLKDFNCYIEHTRPFLRENGGEVMFLGDGGEFLIGLEVERWDLVMMISAQSFLDFSSHQYYMVGIEHWNAAIEDSCLLTRTEIPISK